MKDWPFNIKELSIDRKNENKRFFPLPLRCLIVGNSGSGKTTLLYHLIVENWGIPFYHLYIFSKSLDQPMYQNLKENYAKLLSLENIEIAYFFDKCEDLIAVDECKNNSLVIFDDCVNIREQGIIKDYFVRGRHKNISCIYLSQNFTKVDTQLIRENINFLILFEQRPKYLEYIYKDYIGTDYTYKQFVEICRDCWKKNYSFIAINTTKKLDDGRYIIKK